MTYKGWSIGNGEDFRGIHHWWEAWRDGVRMRGNSEEQIRKMIDLKTEEEEVHGRWGEKS